MDLSPTVGQKIKKILIRILQIMSQLDAYEKNTTVRIHRMKLLQRISARSVTLALKQRWSLCLMLTIFT